MLRAGQSLEYSEPTRRVIMVIALQMTRSNQVPCMASHLKSQEKKRERRTEYDPQESDAHTNDITVDPDTRLMFKELGMSSLPNITTHSAQTRYAEASRKKFLSAAMTGEDLHSEYQIVTKRSTSSCTK